MLMHLQEIRHEITGERLELIEFARKLRSDATDAEALLWSCLRGRRVNDRKFRRQHPVAPYVLDFFCAEMNLAIELDGGQHNSAKGRAHDARRTAFLQSKGIETLRFTNQAMLKDTDSVLGVIWDRTRRHSEAGSAPLTQPLPATSAASSG